MAMRSTPRSTDTESVIKSIRRIVRAIDMRSKRISRETGLTIPQIVILKAIEELGAVTTAAISRHSDISPATAVTILDKLESRGLVTRRRSETDRRIVHTSLTEDGERVLANAPSLLDEEFMRRFAALPPDRQFEIAQGFCTVADFLDLSAFEAPATLNLE